MSVTAKDRAQVALFSLPNQLTLARLVLSVVLFVLLPLGYYAASFVVFVVAASTDWLDGYFARKWNLVTVLGRILDPFVDKVIVCGTFIYLAAVENSGVQAWMAVVIVARELLITALRSFLEQQGADFSAAMSGKLKMLFQCIAAGVSLFYLSWDRGAAPEWAGPLLLVMVWTAVALTVYSGVAYVRTAIGLLRG